MSFKEIVDKIVKEKIDEIRELTDEINHCYLTLYFKRDTAEKTFDGFNNGMILFEKIQHGKIKLEKEKKLQNIFKPNLNEISRGRFKSEEQKIRLLNKSREAVIKLFNDYYSIVSEVKHIAKYGKGLKILTSKCFKDQK